MAQDAKAGSKAGPPREAEVFGQQHGGVGKPQGRSRDGAEFVNKSSEPGEGLRGRQDAGSYRKLSRKGRLLYLPPLSPLFIRSFIQPLLPERLLQARSSVPRAGGTVA